MAFKGRDEATEFERATTRLFKDVFNFETHHVGPIGLTPDVLLISDQGGYCGIIDNKAYSKYSISNDHHNRMVHNYIEGFNRYCQSQNPLAFFSYIAGGFGNNINGQIQSIVREAGVHGCALAVTNVIQMVEKNQVTPYSHLDLKDIFTIDRQVLLSDL